MQTIILWRIAIIVMQNGTLGQTCESAPTVGYHKFNGTSGLCLSDDGTFSTVPHGAVEKVFHRIVGANSYVRPNATYLHDLYIHPSNLCKP